MKVVKTGYMPEKILTRRTPHILDAANRCHQKINDLLERPPQVPNPSRADEEITRKINHAAKFFDIMLLDHIIVSTDGYFSFADEGLLDVRH